MSAADTLRAWRLDPLRFVRECLRAEPDAWQAQALTLLPTTGGTARIALKACAGPGKSTLLAWAGWWFLATQGELGEHPKGIALAITADNLRDNLWPELRKWQTRSSFLEAAFVYQKEKIFARDHPDTWFLSARSFARTADANAQGSTLSGLHSKYIFYLLDESGDMLPSVGRAAEQGLAGAQVGMAIQAGNPTSLSGLLADSATHGWSTVTITADPDDPHRTPRVPAEWAATQIEQYGRDNPWVQAYILGKFPPGGINTLLGLEEVQTSMRRSPLEGAFMHSARVLGVDVARFGDDCTSIIRRQGVMSWAPIIMRGADTAQVGDRVAYEINEWHPDAVFIDGTGIGGGVVDRLRTLGHRRVVDVQFGGAASSARFANKRAEMWWEMAEWIKRTGAVAPDEQMLQELIAPTYSFNEAGRLILEPKADIKKRGKASPDRADSLALTFAQQVVPHELARYLDDHGETYERKRFDPLAKVRRF